MQGTMAKTRQMLTAATTALIVTQFQLAISNSILFQNADYNFPVFSESQNGYSRQFTFGSVETYDILGKFGVIQSFARKILDNSVGLNPEAVDAINRRFWDLI